MATANSPLLSLANVGARYGKAEALRAVSLDIWEGEVVALLGANGAGKSTLLNVISGFIRPSHGAITLAGERIDGDKPHKAFRRGVVQVSQARDLFPAMTVKENLELGAVTRKGDCSTEMAVVFDYFPRLHERREQRVGTLSGGEQQMVALGRALMGRPRILLLDEPSGGLAPKFVQEIGRIMAALKDRGATMMIVEQNIGLALRVADRFYILRDGNVVHTGTPNELGDDLAAVARRYYL